MYIGKYLPHDFIASKLQPELPKNTFFLQRGMVCFVGLKIQVIFYRFPFDIIHRTFACDDTLNDY